MVNVLVIGATGYIVCHFPTSTSLLHYSSLILHSPLLTPHSSLLTPPSSLLLINPMNQGEALSLELRRRGHSVYGLVRNAEKAKKLIKGEVNVVVGDGTKSETYPYSDESKWEGKGVREEE